MTVISQEMQSDMVIFSDMFFSTRDGGRTGDLFGALRWRCMEVIPGIEN